MSILLRDGTDFLHRKDEGIQDKIPLIQHRRKKF